MTEVADEEDEERERMMKGLDEGYADARGVSGSGKRRWL